MLDEKLREHLRTTNWEKYSTTIVENYENLLEKIAPKYFMVKKSNQEGKPKKGKQPKEEETEQQEQKEDEVKK